MTDVKGLEAGTELLQTRNQVTTVSKKQAWLKEMEKARVLVGNAEKQQTEGGRRQVDSELDPNAFPSDAVPSERNISYGAAAEETALQVNVNSAQFIRAAGTQIRLSGDSSLTVGGFVDVPRSLQMEVPGDTEGSRSGRVSLESRLGAELKAQNIKLIPNGDVVNVILRDYRADSRVMDGLVKNIKEHLMRYGIKMGSVMVNGVYFSDVKDDN